MSKALANKLSRASNIRRGLCIWGCKRKATKPCGLCDPCSDANNQRNIARYYRRLHTQSKN